MNVVKKPWFFVVLDRMNRQSKEICPVESLMRLGERITFAVLLDRERAMIGAELDLMLRSNSGIYDQGAIDYLRVFRQQILQLPWYMIMLEQIASCARDARVIRGPLVEAIDDLLLSEMEVNEHVSAIKELNRMLKDDRCSYNTKAIPYLELLLTRLRTGF